MQLYGLVFLLGSLTVSALSDLRRMAAQRDFAEVWGAFTFISLVADIYLLAESDPLTLVAKWALIAGFAYVTLKEHALNISLMDVMAVSAVASLLGPATIIGFFVVLLLLREFLSPILEKFGGGGVRPFLPVAFAATVMLISYGLYGGII